MSYLMDNYDSDTLMPCAAPITIATKVGNISVRCRQCLDCRIKRQSALALRALFEQRTTLSADFWTLTYKDAPVTIIYKDFSDFLKRLRIWNVREGNKVPIRYLSVGEYGSKSGRAHFHALIFNSLSPVNPDLRIRLWPHGFVYIGTVTPASIRYTARYCLKFGEKGQEGIAHWSAKPPLGSDGMRELAAYMRNRGDEVEDAPRFLKIEGFTYSVDDCMRQIFWEEYSEGNSLPIKTLVGAHGDYLFSKKFGDPLEEQRKRNKARAMFFESARFVKEKL